MVLIVYSPYKTRIKTTFSDVQRAAKVCGEGDNRIIFIDDHNFKQFSPLVDVLRFADGCLDFTELVVRYAGGKGHFGLVVGQGFGVDAEEDGFPAVIMKIVANCTDDDPRDNLLTAARRDLEEAYRQLAAAGVKVGRVRASEVMG